MGLLAPILQCLVDQEMTAFHQSDVDQETVSFAINLSMDCRGDGTTAEEIKADEDAAKQQYLDFFSDALNVKFHLFSVSETGWNLDYAGSVDNTSSASPAGTPKTLQNWLNEQKPDAGDGIHRYWTTASSAPVHSDHVIDADHAVATHRLRAAQSWNAPVAHRFGLTHIVRIKRNRISDRLYVILPYFDRYAGQPQFVAKHDDPSGGAEDAAFDYSYDPLGKFGKVVCRTNLIGEGITRAPFDPSKIDPGLTKYGYFAVDKDAENVRRLLGWMEERGASLMVANSALLPQGSSEKDIEEFELLFGITIEPTTPDGKTKGETKAAAWYTATRLISALDNLIIALLKPAAVSSGARVTEGEVLAPFVSALIQRIEQEAAAAKLTLDLNVLNSSRLTGAIRKVLTENSPLISDKGAALLVKALRHVYGLSAPPKVLDERTLVTALLDDFHNPHQEIDPQYVPYMRSIKGKSAPVISRALLDLEQTLHDEAGAEAALVRLIETVETTADASPPVPDKRFSALLAAAITSDASLGAAVQRAANVAWGDYRAVLNSPFNGAEAIRRAAGSTYVLELLSVAEHLSGRKKGTTSEYLRWLARASSFYERRFFERPKKLHGLTESLLKPDVTRLSASAQSALRLQLRRAFYAALTPLKSINDSNARFIPDNAPQPLAIQIAANIDGSRIDRFGKYLNGIGIVIQRADLGTTPDSWAYAHLADLAWTQPPKNHPTDEPPPDVTGAIHSMLPAASDGRNPMFIEYQGFPFSDEAIDARIVDNEAGQSATRRRQFYRHAPHVADDGFAKVPRLAYGRTFKSFSFVTSNAGTLPLALQLSPDSPWMPIPIPLAPVPDETDPLRVLVGEADYQRRTAIAQMAVIESTEPNAAPRIGAQIPGVKPLATDYPRVGLQAEKDEPGVRDILREADGSGKMAANQNFEWIISHIEFTGAPAKLTISFFERPAKEPTDKGDEAFEINETSVPGFARSSEIRIAIKFTPQLSERWLSVKCGDKLVGSKKLSNGSSVVGWLRLVLEADHASPATMTFANIGSQKIDNVSEPLLLLAPMAGNWKDGLSDPVEITVSTPRVGYLDFDRWFANRDLRIDMFSLAGDDDTVADSVDLFEQALIAAYVMRHIDPILGSFLDRLPDPAVEQVRIDLALHDTLIKEKVVSGVTHQIHPLKNKLRNFGRGFSALIDDMITKENLPKPGINDQTPWTPQRLRRYVFEPLDKLFKFRIILATQTPVDPDNPGPRELLSLTRLTANSNPPQDLNAPPTFSAAVPEGVIARLSIDSVVPRHHFERGVHPSVFHPGLMQYATRVRPGGDLAFPAAALRIETMYDGMKELAAKKKGENNQRAIELAAAAITAEGIQRTRRFDLMTAADITDADQFRHWRLLGEIDVTTQRWRTTGRPIYHYVNPREHRLDDVDGKVNKSATILHPALPLKLDTDKLAPFELEAFFNRPDVDAQTVTHCLDPLPARNKLQEHYWNSGSATYFRHRFTLRSRYAGALRDRSVGEVIAWPIKDLKTAAHGWTMRVAMLADLSRIQLTRPQLRTLIPLTTAPDGDNVATPAPPVVAILQEPPFARGGLADRIAAEVKTGFGYGFTDDKGHVEILDSRKEAGPDPRLDYRPLKVDTALGLVLRREGPMGLTFDNVDAPAPAYPNSMFSLAPATLFGEQPPLEELFVGVTMRRYIDPGWTTSENKTDGLLDGERCWWIAFGESQISPGPLLAYTIDGKEQPLPLLVLKTSNPTIEVMASKFAIDGVGTTSKKPDDDPVPILKVDKARFVSLAILHQPVAPGRYSTSIFVVTNSANTGRGEINAPLMLASFDWSPPGVKTGPDENIRKPPFVELEPLQANVAYVTMASAPTFLKWTKTSRAFDFVHLPKLNQEGTAWIRDRRHVRELVAALDTNHHDLTFELKGVENAPVWLSPSTFDNPYPVHVHRHLGIITSHFLKELGRPMELFCRTAVLRDKKAVMIAPDGNIQNGTPYQPRDHIARIVEFETPAQILCASSVLAAKKYKTAYFDLVSTRFVSDVGKTGSSLSLHFRIVGPPAHQRAFADLKISLWQTADPNVVPITIPLKWTNTAALFTVGVQLSFRQLRNKPSETKAVVVAHLLRSDGTREKAPDIPSALILTTPTHVNPGLFVSVDADTPTGHEFWTDVSLLHSSNDNEYAPLDFDWLFSPGSDAEPAESVSSAGLNMMNEVQARVIAVSPPIPIVRH